MDEFERRVELANRADDSAALRKLVEGLPLDAADFAPPPARVQGASGAKDGGSAPRADRESAYLVNRGRVPKKDEFAAIFSSAERVGSWTAALHFEAAAIFGSGHIDLRNALIPREGIKIEGVGIFGSLTIVVPEGVNLRVRNISIFGSATGGGNSLNDPDAPTIEIEAVGIFGSCAVKVSKR
jgi:hypothetical protein